MRVTFIMDIPVLYVEESQMEDLIDSGTLFIYRLDHVYDFEDEEIELISKLEECLRNSYSEQLFFVSNDVWPGKVLTVQISSHIFNIETIELFIDFLERNAEFHCIDMGIIDSNDVGKIGSRYLGHFIMCLNQIIIGSTIKELWDVRITK